jgi:hypothetical protein
MAKWLGAPLGGGVTTATRAKDTDRQETCAALDNALNDGELSGEEHRERVSKATNAVTLGDLKQLLSDLQGSTPTRLRAAKSNAMPAVRARGIGIAVLVVSVLFGMGLGWGLYGNTSSPLDFTTDPGAKPDGVAAVVLTPPKQLQSLGGLTGLLEQARKKFGDTIGYRLLVYPTYASIYRPDPADDRRVLDYDYRGGWDDPTASPKTDKTVAVDLSKFDVKTAVGIMRGAPETLGIKASEVKSTYLIVEPAKDPTAPGTLTLSVYISSDYGSGSIDFAGDGTIKRVNYPSS